MHLASHQQCQSNVSVAKRIWDNEPDATAWLNPPHPELEGTTPLFPLKTEAGGRRVETLLAALESRCPSDIFDPRFILFLY